MLLQCDNKVPFVCKGLSANIQPAQRLHTDWWTFHPPTHTHTIFHSSRVNIIYRVDSRFFHPDPKMKELILGFLRLSFTHTLCHISYPAISLTHTWTDWCNSPFSAICSPRMWGTRCCGPGHTFTESFFSTSVRAYIRSKLDWWDAL